MHPAGRNRHIRCTANQGFKTANINLFYYYKDVSTHKDSNGIIKPVKETFR